jgi:hypothetical protein
MPIAPLTQLRLDLIWAEWLACKSVTEVYRRTGHCRDVIYKEIRRRAMTKNSLANLEDIDKNVVPEIIDFAKPKIITKQVNDSQIDPSLSSQLGEIERKFRGDDMEIVFTVDSPITTPEEAFVRSGADPTIWYIEDYECTAYQVVMRVRRGQDSQGRQLADSPHLKQLWRVKIRVKRVLAKPFQVAHEALFQRMKAFTPEHLPISRPRIKSPYLLEIDLFDVHFGKLAWKRESGQDQDLKIIERLFFDAFEDLLAEISGREIERILIPVGNDFFHIDGVTNQTTSGTPVDTDGRYAKIIEIGQMAMVYLIERAVKIASVEVKHIPGNHDRIASWHLCHYLQAWFRTCADVTIDTEPRPRKFVAYGRHLIGLTHGSEEKTTSLPAILMNEAKDLWAAADYGEWHLGHFHKKKQVETTTIDTHDGIKIRNLHALSAIDSWHYRKGYVGGRRAAEAFLFARDSGNTTNIEVELRRTM